MPKAKKRPRKPPGLQVVALPHIDRKALGVLLVAPKSRKKLPWWPDVDWVAITWSKRTGVTGWTLPIKLDGAYVGEEGTKIRIGDGATAPLLVQGLIEDWEDIHGLSWNYALGLCQSCIPIEVG